jgi:DNA-binding MurR/RpiR family transcriptional regulator
MKDNIRELKKRIKSNIHQLTESQKVIVNYIIEKPQKFALGSVRELEKELNTSKSTIVRLAQALGYDGFYELKSAFLEGIRHKLEPIHRYKAILSEMNEKSSFRKPNYLQFIADETVNNINTTLHLIDMEQYTKAVKLIENASYVYTIGFGISNYLAEIASFLFTRVSIKSHSLAYGGITFAEQIINLSKDDLIIAFSFPPYSKETIDAAGYAHEKRIKVIAVSDKVTNKIVPYSDAFLQVAVESMTISNSIMAVLVLLYSVAAQIGHDLKNRTLETIKAIEHVRKKHIKGTP